jgi:NADPH:quinone reductase-like Zn-dependent oxidoreductase
VSDWTGGQGFDIVYDIVGGATLDDSFTAVKRYTEHTHVEAGSHGKVVIEIAG